MKIKKVLFVIIAIVAVSVTGTEIIADSIPDGLTMLEGGDGSYGVFSVVPVSASSGQSLAQAKLFGWIPVKTVSVHIFPRVKLMPGGDTFGVKLFTKGVMVVGMGNILTAEGNKNPASDAGIKVNDIIMQADGREVNTIEGLSAVLEKSSGNPIKLKYIREEKEYEALLQPVLCADDGKYKVGLWVRDSTAGIGTVTFFDPVSGVMAGLGHGICDIDTGKIMPLMNGSIVKADITGIVKSVKGSPGELVGQFNGKEIGQVLGNIETGIYGRIDNVAGLRFSDALEICPQSEVEIGPAYIISNIGNGPERFQIEIIKLVKSPIYNTKNITIKIVDERLIGAAGGIVQGMSGSPIVQNKKLVGAVTHVTINDPTKGYGIYIENMLSKIPTFAE